ncbi:HEAT repeat domain-containing protein [Paenibacillus sp. MMS20-IR301]|uniref:HEAT repeat domain-containing protein n=1 Tax=Paenibacillus sp. MMS20-IR301 TaxID=2895946 RepID=UPI0028F0F769|nr:HEAT repeat domain-containing protein [Paenibacillus sp. MMS20-IR301]WNS41478.1 HEAT repeat domain-containing protein [Paenibacillus sp. MMS20-IR301]
MKLTRDPLDKQSFLKELDSLGYSDRSKKVAILGREHLGSARYSELLSSLLEDGAYEARLALTGAIATLDVPVILSALRHPLASIRNTAAGLLAKVASEEEIERELPGMSQDCRRKLLRTISQLNRRELAERILPVVHARSGAEEAAIVLQACTPATVSQWLGEIGYAVKDWKKLAIRHLDVVAVYFVTTLEDTPLREKGRVWSRFSSAMELLCKEKPELVLANAMTNGPMGSIHPAFKKQLGPLVRQYPDAVYQLLTQSELRSDLIRYGVPEGVLKRKKYLSLEQWTELAKLLADYPNHIANLLYHMAPSSRREIFDAVYPEDKRKGRIFPDKILYVLPHALRDGEAARMLDLREIRDDRERTLRITACRSIRHSREKLEQAAQVSSADERGAALMQLIRSTALSRQGMQETLVYLGRIRNDQDPVRGLVFKALSESPASAFTDSDVPQLEVLVDSVIDARDTSYGTKYSVQQLAFAILRHTAVQPHSGLFRFALDTITKLARQSGQLSLPSLERNMPKGVEELIFDEIYTLAAQAGRRENYNLLFSLANSFGTRGHGIQKLQHLLEEAAKVKSESTAMQAARYWLAPHKTRDARVKELLSLDKSYIKIQEVFQHLHLRRQEWLDPFISGNAVKGRFLSGKTIYLVPAEGGFYRWLPRQQQAYQALLDKVVSDPKRNLWERARAIRIMAGMPDLRPDRLFGLVQDKEVAVAEAALHALSLTEEPEKVLPVLLDNLDGDRARVAMYSIPRCIRRVNPELLTAMLKELLQRDKLKITVRKEAVRLLGAYRSGDSLPLLLNEFRKPKTHKDVIIAIGHAARQLLDDERSWGILEAMAASPQTDIVLSILSERPANLPLDYRPRYLALILAIAGHADIFAGRHAFIAMLQWTSGHEAVIAAATARAITDLQDDARWEFAMITLVETCRDGKVNDVIIRVCGELAGAAGREEWNAASTRDLPHRQRLLKLVNQLTSLPRITRMNLIPLYTGIADCLAANETLQQAVVKLNLAVIDWNDVEASAAYVTRIARCIANQPLLLGDAYDQLTHLLEDDRGYWNAETLLTIVDQLGADGAGDEPAYLGLALLEAAGRTLLWTPEPADRLRAYRQHGNIGVRTHAMNIWTNTE